MFSHLRPFTAVWRFPSGFPTALFCVLLASPVSKYHFPAKEIKSVIKSRRNQIAFPSPQTFPLFPDNLQPAQTDNRSSAYPISPGVISLSLAVMSDCCEYLNEVGHGNAIMYVVQITSCNMQVTFVCTSTDHFTETIWRLVHRGATVAKEWLRWIEK
jgi:hypothetical protein